MLHLSLTSSENISFQKIKIHDDVFLAPVQLNNGFQGRGGIAADMMLAVPGRAVCGDEIFADAQHGLIVVDHPDAVAEHFPPEPCVGTLAYARMK